jgi:CheY-like chemotaxis protein
MDETAAQSPGRRRRAARTERLQLLLARLGGVDLVGTASDGEARLPDGRGAAPDLLLLDIAMPGMDGIDVARALGAPRALGRRSSSSPPSTSSPWPPSRSRRSTI